MLGPRLVIAGTHSGVGKTTVATGLMAAFSAAGERVASAKVGPDFIDPGYHSLATGRAPRNLDPWMCGPDAMQPLAARAADGADLLLIEGVMGLFDGAVDGTPSSTADVATLLEAPVVLVVDGSSMSASVAALVRGFRDHRPELRLAGVILNRVGSPHHETLLVDALADIGVDVLGTLPRDDAFTWRDRHLGLVPVEERPEEVTVALRELGAAMADRCDLDALARIANAAPEITTKPLHGEPLDAGSPTPVANDPVRVAVAGGPAFTFLYRDNVEALTAAGAELVSFDPLDDEHLPDNIGGLIIGGGFPEEFASRLADNTKLMADVATAIDSGVATWAECGGLLWLGSELDGHPMVGALPSRSRMTDRLTLGYREATANIDNPVLAAGDQVRGHEFHYSQTEPGGDAITLRSRFNERAEGFATPGLFATYLHLHLGTRPDIAQRFVRACSEAAARTSAVARPGAVARTEQDR